MKATFNGALTVNIVRKPEPGEPESQSLVRYAILSIRYPSHPSRMAS